MYTQKKITPSVFRAYDIRGIVGMELNEDSYYSIGLAIACYLQKRNRQRLYLARDGRLSSESLALALKTGLLSSGIDVLDLGQTATPVMYYATYSSEIDCGLMVTGSHNPADYNGIKMVLAGKTTTYEDIAEIFQYVENGARLTGNASESFVDIIPEYQARLIQDIQLDRPLKIVVDAGNGIAGPIAPVVLKKLGCEIIPLFCEVDGRFPNHHPDPTIEKNLIQLKNAVQEHGADLGLAFDGDADRLGLVTNHCETIFPDRLMMLYVQEVLSRLPGAVIVYDVKCSSHLQSVIEAHGGVGVMCPTGHAIVKGIMKEKNAALAGEMSGHLFFKDRWYGFDDAMYSACRLVEILSRSNLSVSEQFAKIPDSINTPELKIEITDTEKFNFMENFMNKADFPSAKLIKIDGLRVEFEQGWGLLRASNTTPCLVARFEAQNETVLQHIKRLFSEQMRLLNPLLELPF